MLEFQGKLAKSMKLDTNKGNINILPFLLEL